MVELQALRHDQRHNHHAARRERLVLLQHRHVVIQQLGDAIGSLGVVGDYGGKPRLVTLRLGARRGDDLAQRGSDLPIACERLAARLQARTAHAGALGNPWWRYQCQCTPS